jgi:hypothetical protein
MFLNHAGRVGRLTRLIGRKVRIREVLDEVGNVGMFKIIFPYTRIHPFS